MTLRSASSHSWSPQLKWDLLRSSGRGKQEKTKKSTFYNFLNSFTYTRGMINSWTFPVTEILKRGLCVNYRIFDLITIYFTRNLSYLSLNCNCNIVNVCKNFLIHDRPFQYLRCSGPTLFYSGVRFDDWNGLLKKHTEIQRKPFNLYKGNVDGDMFWFLKNIPVCLSR